MTIRIGFILTLLMTSISLFAQKQLEVIVEFTSVKTVSTAKKEVFDLASKSGNTQDPAPVWSDLRSARSRHIAVVKSSKSLEEWEATPGVLRVSISQPVEPRNRIPNDPTFSDQWDMEQIEAPAAWEYTTGGSSFSGRKITIGVIENNGFQLNHPDLRDAIFVNQAEIPNDNIDNDNNGFVDDVSGWNYTDNQNGFERHNHGTKVMGTLGARGDNGVQAVGVNWETSMVPLQVASFGQWVLALDYLTDLRRRYNETNGAEGAYVVVANMSLGALNSGTCDPDLNDAFDRAGEEGILCIGATSNNLGNLDQNPDPSSDCTSDYLIIVTASNREDDIFRSSSYSTTDVDIAAPGEEYPTIDYVSLGNPDPTFSGTSGATPHVAGAIALAYSIDCPTLDEISLLDPAGAALIVKDAMLQSGDEAFGLAAQTTSGKRLNVRKAIESLLLEDCLVGDMIVQFEENQTPPNTLTDDAGELSIVRTLSSDWNIHLYNSAGGALSDHVAQLEAMSSVAAAEPNIRLILRGRQPNDPGFQTQTSLSDMQASDGWETVYGAEGTPPPSRIVTAIFDQNFDLNSPDLEGKIYANSDELASNGIDDDGNGYIDDANGFNLTARSSDFSEGNHGFAVAAIAAANANDGFGIAGVDWTGSVLPLEGNTLAQWIEGAAYIAPLRSRYNESQGADGALVVSYVTPQGGLLLREGGTLIPNVLDRLETLGVLAIGATVNDDAEVSSDFPTSIDHDALLNTAFAFIGDVGGDIRGFDESNMPLFLPSDNTAYALTQTDTLRLSGSSAASALTAGSLSLLYQTPCADFERQAFQAPMATASRLKRALLRSTASVGEYQNDIVQLNIATEQVAGACIQGEDCGIISLYPNPVPAQGHFTFEMVSSPTTNTCPVSIYDPIGRVVFRQNLDLDNGYREVELPVSILGNGLYFLSTGAGDATQTRSLIRGE